MTKPTGTIPDKRPLSPHLQIYRLPLTAILSITHRITGVILSLGLLVSVWLLWALAENSDGLGSFLTFTRSLAGKSLIGLWILALFVHFCHGIRHLLWDLGLAFERDRLGRHSLIELVAAVILALLAWLVF